MLATTISGTPRGRVYRMTEDRYKWRKYVHGVANSQIENTVNQILFCSFWSARGKQRQFWKDCHKIWPNVCSQHPITCIVSMFIFTRWTSVIRVPCNLFLHSFRQRTFGHEVAGDFSRLDSFPSPSQQCQSTEWNSKPPGVSPNNLINSSSLDPLPDSWERDFAAFITAALQHK